MDEVCWPRQGLSRKHRCSTLVCSCHQVLSSRKGLVRRTRWPSIAQLQMPSSVCSLSAASKPPHRHRDHYLRRHIPNGHYAIMCLRLFRPKPIHQVLGPLMIQLWRAVRGDDLMQQFATLDANRPADILTIIAETPHHAFAFIIPFLPALQYFDPSHHDATSDDELCTVRLRSMADVLRYLFAGRFPAMP
jgi:hypothetical protein